MAQKRDSLRRDKLRLLGSHQFHRLEYRSTWAFITSSRVNLAEAASAAAALSGAAAWAEPVVARAELRARVHNPWCPTWGRTQEGVDRIQVIFYG